MVRALDVIVFNGSVTALDPGTGHQSTRCVLSVRAERKQFEAINLRNIQPHACFDALKGVTGKKLSDLKTVKPLDAIDFSGERFSTAQTLTEESSSALNEWHELVKAICGPEDVRFLPVGSLAMVLGFPAAEKYPVALSREIAKTVASRGFAIEPDVRHGTLPYRSSDEIALFRPLDPNVTTAYNGASALLHLCVMIAAADNQITEGELSVARDFIRQSAALNPGEQQRIQVLECLLCRTPDIAKRSLTRLTKRLAIRDREMIGDVLVCVAGADGIVSNDEWNALNRAFNALELPPSSLEATLAKLGAHFEDPIVQEAEPPIPGEQISIPEVHEKPAARHQFTLDMDRIAQISRETKDVIGLLANVMSEEEPASSTSAIPQPNLPVIASETEQKERNIAGVSDLPSTSGPQGYQVPLDTLPEKYRSLFSRLVARDQWPQAEFAQLASEFNLMPLGVIDTINEWADDCLGDFLLEGEDPIILNRELLERKS